MNIVLVTLGGAIGALLRYLIMYTLSFSWMSFPYGTLLINVIGSFAIGFLAFWLANHYCHNQSISIFLIVGVLGAFTTFSTFSLDTLHLFIEQRYIAAFIYVLFSVILCIMAAFLGMLFSKYT